MAGIKNNRIIEYDILKFFGAFGIVIWHIGPVPSRYVVWAVSAFVFTTWALQRNKQITFRKLMWSMLNIGYVYLIVVVLSLILFGLKPIRPMLDEFSLSFEKIYKLIIENAYIGILWYLVLHFQFIIVLWLFGNWLNRQNRLTTAIFGFIISQIWVFTLDLVFHDYLGIFFVSWLFICFVGYYYGKDIIGFVNSLTSTKQALVVVSSISLTLLIMNNEFVSDYFSTFRDNQFFFSFDLVISGKLR